MNINLIHEIERLATKLRVAFDLPTERQCFKGFEQISFDDLSNNISEAFPYIKIVNENADGSYMVKHINSDSTADTFKIYISKDATEEQKLDLLMHEFAHVFFHKNSIPYNTPLGKNQGNWEQELEADYFARAFLLPEEFFIKALSIYSRNDGTVDLEQFSKFFKVQKRLIVERGRDLKIW